MVNVQQEGNDQFNGQVQVIVPRSSFSCSGRLTGYLVSLDQDSDEDDYPHIEIWRPSALSGYRRIAEYVLTESDITEMDNYYFANVSFAINETTQFQPGDAIGYYQPSSPHYTVWSVDTEGYVSHTAESRGGFFFINLLSRENNRQPLIQVLYGMLNYLYNYIICSHVRS